MARRTPFPLCGRSPITLHDRLPGVCGGSQHHCDIIPAAYNTRAPGSRRRVFWCVEDLRVYSRARARAFTPETIRSAYRTTGLIPRRRDFLCPDAMAPALERSTKGGFPLPLPSPVRAIVDAHRRARGILRVPALAIVPEGEEGEREDATAEAEVDLSNPPHTLLHRLSNRSQPVSAQTIRYCMLDRPIWRTLHGRYCWIRSLS